MLVTAQKLDESLHKIRDIDFSAFYREVQFSDPDKGINREMIMKEIMPDIILMPNAGTRSMMWQETAGVRRDTSARFLFPIFTAVDIDDMMVGYGRKIPLGDLQEDSGCTLERYP